MTRFGGSATDAYRRARGELSGSGVFALAPEAAKAPGARAESSDVPEFLVFGVIGQDCWGDGVTPRDVVSWLAQNADAPEVRVRINSPGGDAFDGIAIHNALVASPQRVVVDVEGAAFSAASLIAMAGDTIRIADNAMMMVHRAWNLSVGNVEDHAGAIAILGRIDGAQARTYATRAGIETDAALALMEAETFMSGSEAVDQGFADEVIPTKSGSAEVAKAWAGSKILARFRASSVRTALDSILGSTGGTQERDEIMPEWLLKRLGLPSDASEAQAQAKLEVLCKTDPGLRALVALPTEGDPQADADNYARDLASAPDVAQAEANARIAKLERMQAASNAREAVQAAVRAGKVFPGEAALHVADLTEGGAQALERFEKVMAVRPQVIDFTQGSQTAGKDAPAASAVELTESDRYICDSSGLSEELFLATKTAKAADAAAGRLKDGVVSNMSTISTHMKKRIPRAARAQITEG